MLIRWHPTFWEIGRDVHPIGHGVALEYRSRGGRILALAGYFPADQDVEVVCSLLAFALSFLAPHRGVYTLLLGDRNTNPGWPAGFLTAPTAITTLWDDFLRDTGLSQCTPRVEAPTWVDGCGCVGVIDHILGGGGVRCGGYPIPVRPPIAYMGCTGRVGLGDSSPCSPAGPACPGPGPGHHRGLSCGVGRRPWEAG